MNSSRSEFHAPFRLAEWTVRPGLNRIEGPDGNVQVEPRVMQVLLRLADSSREVCSRQALLDEVWGEAIVGEENLTRAISELRRIFGESARDPRFIETIRHHGYRLLVAVELLDPAGPEAAVQPAPESAPDSVPEADLESAPDGGPAPVPEPRPEQDDKPAPGPEPVVEPVSAPPPAAPDRSRRIPVGWYAAVAAVILLVLAGWLGPRWVGQAGSRAERTQPATYGLNAAVPLTSFTGREWHPALSPDGLRVAFIWAGPEGDNADLYLKQRSSETVLRLSDDPGWAAWPAWSPDGQELAFVQQCGDRSCLCVVPSIGGAVRELLEVDSWVEGLDWSPDGTRLAFSARDGQDGRHRIRLLDLADLRVTTAPLERDGAAGDYLPRFSPDGAYLAWIGAGLSGNSGIYRAPAVGGRAERLTSGLNDLQGLAWLADGSGLVYAEAQAGRFQLWRLPLEANAAPEPAEWIPASGEFAWNPSIARLSGDLAYEQVRVDQDIWRVRVLEQDPWQVESAPFLRSTRWESAASVSAAGDRIVFVSTRSGSPQIWLCDRGGGDLRRLTGMPYPSVANPRFAPDGRTIAATVLRGGRPAVLVVGVRGGEPRVVTAEGESEVFASWSPEGELVLGAETSSGWQIFAADPSSPGRRALTRDGGVVGRLTPDGDLIYTRPGRRGLWRLRPGTDVPEPLVADLDSRDLYDWLLVGESVAWVMRLGGRSFLALQELDAQEPSILAELPDLAEAGLGAAPDGSAFFYTRTQASSGDLMLVPAADDRR